VPPPSPGRPVTPAGLLFGAIHKAESVAADVTGRLTGTPEVLSRLLDAERMTRQALRTVNQVRSGVVHVLMIPTTQDVAAMRREIERVHGSLAEIEARLDDRAGAQRGEHE
jgi:hypothetical protein